MTSFSRRAFAPELCHATVSDSSPPDIAVRSRPGAGCKPARGHRTRPVHAACRPQPVRLGEVRSICNVIGDKSQRCSDITFFAIAGLDPAIHAAAPNVRQLSMDHRHRIFANSERSTIPGLQRTTIVHEDARERAYRAALRPGMPEETFHLATVSR